ncbi:MAG: nickel pincer cofactor biosynthesis protein LarB [Nitrospiraceae bacterium]|nr:MAG: nickel pincer cofactor biosynthesis protein LarB [Nitrospiraceae bacterium]
MHSNKIKHLLQLIEKGDLSANNALKELKDLPYEDIGVAKVDHHRELRHGIPEVIFAEGKERKDIKAIAESMLKKSGRLFITRASKEIYSDIGVLCNKIKKKPVYFEKSGVITVGQKQRKSGLIAVFCAGTSDMAVSEEASVTAAFLGSKVSTITDVGVAGLHRLADARDIFSEANVLIVAAGMEGALPSVIGGMTDKPIIAVPTSVGYGTSLGGITALFAMLNSCVPGIGVMNIDNGFGAGVLAHKINMLCKK